jgi:hypothetical protein
VGVSVLRYPYGVACSAFNELVVADYGTRCLRVFSVTGDVLATLGEGYFTGMALHGSTVFAASVDAGTVTVYE